MRIAFVVPSLLLAWLVLPCLAAEYDFSGRVEGVLTDCTLQLESGSQVTLACIQPKTGAYLYLAEKLIWLYPNVTYPNYICYFYGEIYGGSMYTCMVYAPWNETHLINVNKALVNASKATMTDFALYEWPFFKEVSAVIPEFPSALVLSLFMMATLLAVIVYRKKKQKLSKATFSF